MQKISTVNSPRSTVVCGSWIIMNREIFNAVADGLANNGYAVTEHFLSHEEVRNILLAPPFAMPGDFKKAGIGHNKQLQINESVRGDYIQWIDQATALAPLQVYLRRLHDLRVFLNENLFLSLKDCEIHCTVYPIGTFYKRHIDQFKTNDHRKLSVICYLNDGWQATHGGQLRIYVDNKQFDVLPEAGRLVCFRSDLLEHEVLPATRERKSITGWMLDQWVDLKQL